MTDSDVAAQMAPASGSPVGDVGCGSEYSQHNEAPCQSISTEQGPTPAYAGSTPSAEPAGALVEPDGERRFQLCYYESLKDTRSQVLGVTFESLEEILTSHQVREEKDGPLFSPVILKPGYATRQDAAVASVSMLVADLDETYTLEQVTSKVQGYHCFLYSTFRHGIAEKAHAPAPGERYRVVFLLSRLISDAEFPQLWLRFQVWWDGVLDYACRNISRHYFLPACRPEGPVESEVFCGRLLNPDDLPQVPLFEAVEVIPGPVNTTNERPGDDFDVRANPQTIVEMMEKAGYVVFQSECGVYRVRRPGKVEPGMSGTIGYVAPNVYYNFSSNDKYLDPNRAYSPYQLKAFLEHNGDFTAAAKALAKDGYGLSEDEFQVEEAIRGVDEFASDATDGTIDDDDVRTVNCGSTGSSKRVDTDNVRRVEAKGAEKRNGRRPEKGFKTSNSQACTDILMTITSSIELFHTPDQSEYGRADKEIFKLGSRRFKEHLGFLYYSQTKKPAPTQAIDSTVDILRARARYEGPEKDVYIRMAMVGESIYVDLADKERMVVEVTASGWKVTDEVPVMFMRPEGMLSLPVPEQGGSIDLLRDYVNLKDEDDFRMVIAYLCACFNSSIPLPILVVTGEPGSAKSTLTQFIKLLVDSNKVATRGLPRSTQELAIAASLSWLMCFDNISQVPKWLSDELCRLAYGSSFSTRKLYTDDEEATLHSRRPLLLNGIGDIATQTDLLDRSILLDLPAIADAQRRTEQELMERFTADRPRILGALLSAVSGGLAALPKTSADGFPRMADFSRWITACEAGLHWPPGSFMEAYNRNRDNSRATALDASCVAPILIPWLRQRGTTWVGSSSDLLKELSGYTGFSGNRLPHGWPSDGTAMGKHLCSIAKDLQVVGIQAIQQQRTKKGRSWSLTYVDINNLQTGAQDQHPSPQGNSPAAGSQLISANAGVAGGVGDAGDAGDAANKGFAANENVVQVASTPVEPEITIRQTTCENAVTDHDITSSWSEVESEFGTHGGRRPYASEFD